MSMNNQEFLEVSELWHREVAGHHCLERERVLVIGATSLRLRSVLSAPKHKAQQGLLPLSPG